MDPERCHGKQPSLAAKEGVCQPPLTLVLCRGFARCGGKSDPASQCSSPVGACASTGLESWSEIAFVGIPTCDADMDKI